MGEVAMWLRGRPVDLGHARRRAVLGALLVDANTAVPADRLIDRVWGEEVPARARTAVRTYLSHLRKLLEPRAPPSTGAGTATR
ncbi:winged helix-turn-helix domain-containing protein [Actinokineospora soli]|uniref:Winged helix-turn-helix domain-containing protein n=1 Tax=Actinokineospora soli TaxID=1048753 RepID=A0ABW2TSI0_9PSEU